MFRLLPRSIFRRCFLAALAVAGATALWGWFTSRGIVVDTFKWEIPEWKGTDKSMTLLLVADIHLRPNEENRIREIIEQAIPLQPDAVLLLGDFPYGSKEPEGMSPFVYAPLLRQFNAPVYAVLGNHDTSYGFRTIQEALEKAGIPVLNPGTAFVEGKNGARIQLSGVGDIISRETMVRKRGVPARIRKDEPYILMSHSHEIAPLAPEGINLIVAGHTHGGQICLPGGKPLGEVIGKLSHSDAMSGLQYVDGHPVLISRGIGCSLMPLRIFCPPQIILLKLEGQVQ